MNLNRKVEPNWILGAPSHHAQQSGAVQRSREEGDIKGTLTPLLSREEIAAAVKRLARQLDRDYYDLAPVMVGILRGAFIFLADLVREMDTPGLSVEFLRLGSYGSSTSSSGKARIAGGLPPQNVLGRHVIVVEDIVDTGITTTTALRYLRRHRPASLRVCALLDKPARRQMPVCISYLGFKVPDRFVVGYGIDLDQQHRQLPDIYTVES